MPTSAIITLIFLVAVVVAAVLALRGLFRRETVYEWETGLLYRDGAFERRLDSGSILLFGKRQRLIRIGMRENMNVVPSQDVLSQDNVGVKISLLLRWTIDDPVKVINSVEGGEEPYALNAHLHGLAQLALRRAVGAMTLEALLDDRDAAAVVMTEELTPVFAALGITLNDVAVRDIMLAGNVRTAYAAKTLAALDAAASLERARGEAAALRSLANAARQLKDNPDLFQLRLIQAVEQAEGSPNIVVDLANTAGVAARGDARATPARKPARKSKAKPSRGETDG